MGFRLQPQTQLLLTKFLPGMKLSLLILCFSCVCLTTAQKGKPGLNMPGQPPQQKLPALGPDERCIQCLWDNRRCYPCRRPCTYGPPSACRYCVRRLCSPCVQACSEDGVTCGSGTKEEYCFHCPSGLDNCQGIGKHPDCIWTKSDNCIPRRTYLFSKDR